MCGAYVSLIFQERERVFFSEGEDAAARMHKFIFGRGLPRTTFTRVLPHNEI